MSFSDYVKYVMSVRTFPDLKLRETLVSLLRNFYHVHIGRQGLKVQSFVKVIIGKQIKLTFLCSYREFPT